MTADLSPPEQSRAALQMLDAQRRRVSASAGDPAE
jgi:hypothetical protein